MIEIILTFFCCSVVFELADLLQLYWKPDVQGWQGGLEQLCRL